MRIAISGHRGLSDEVTALIRDAMRVELAPYAKDGQLVGLSCLADGADQIFAHLILEAGGTLEAVIPATKYRAALPPETWPSYDALLARATDVHRINQTESTPSAHMLASQTMVGMCDLLFAVWDGKPARAYGGTADVVADAQQQAIPVTVIWPAGAHRA